MEEVYVEENGMNGQAAILAGEGTVTVPAPGRKGVEIELRLSDDGSEYAFCVRLGGMPFGGGSITNEGLGPVRTAEKIARMAHLDRACRG